jgi:hypothetical protein
MIGRLQLGFDQFHQVACAVQVRPFRSASLKGPDACKE